MRGRLFVVALSHLDSQWRWTLRRSVCEFLPHTVVENRERFARFPWHVLSFEGAFRYRLLEEYFPRHLEEIQRWVERGNWSPAGAAWEAMDCMLPTSEALIRQILHGQRLFRRLFGRESEDLLLPDCFGFPAALPTVAAHCGVRGFSTQKLRLREKLRAVAPIPFHLGIWEGPDGSELLAALDPGGYGEPVATDLAHDPEWRARFADFARRGLPRLGLLYTGVGDQGGALPAESLAQIERALARPEGHEVRQVASHEPFRILERERQRLPRYRGELLLALHATGGYSSRLSMKRAHRLTERAVSVAERAAATLMPRSRLACAEIALGEAWRRLLAHQMHDTLCGTCIPEAYDLAAQDLAVARRSAEAVLGRAAAAAADRLDTACRGSRLLVFNPIPRAREALVVARIDATELPPGALEIETPDGQLLLGQAAAHSDRTIEVSFVASLPPLGWSLFALRAASGTAPSDLSAEDGVLENRRLRAEFDSGGDLVRLIDKTAGRDCLRAPVRFELFDDRSPRFPSWEILPATLAGSPVERFEAPANVRLLERGPARARLASVRRLGASRLETIWTLAAGAAGTRLELSAGLDWWQRGRLLKARFDFAAGDAVATYDGGLGVVERGVNEERCNEVPGQRWADLSERSAAGGTAVLSLLHAGWDRPAEATLRLTLVHTPATGRRFRFQRLQDLGHQRLEFALYPHRGGWREGEVVAQAEEVALPPVAFLLAGSGRGSARQLAGLAIDRGPCELLALKPAEAADGEVVVRLRETAGAPAAIDLRWPDPVLALRPLDGCERPLAPADVSKAPQRVELRGFGLATFGARFASLPSSEVRQPALEPLDLPCDRVLSGRQGVRSSLGFDGHGTVFPQELLADPLAADGESLPLTRDEEGRLLGLSCRGQQIALGMAAEAQRLVLVAARSGGDRRVRFDGTGFAVELLVHDWRQPLETWDLFLRHGGVPWRRFRPGSSRAVCLAWSASHLHDRRGRDRVLEPGHLFRYRLALPAGVAHLRLPADPRVLLVGAYLEAAESPLATLATPPFD